MSDIVLNPIGSGYNLSKFNVNFQAIEDKINNEILHLSGGNNLMGQPIDMNSNRIINLPEPVSGHEPVRFQDYINFDSQIQSLAQSSAQGDAALSNSIQSESASRQAADANLQNQINSNDADISDLESEIGLLAPSTDPEAKNKVTSLSDITSLSSLNTAALVDGQQFSVKDGILVRKFAWNTSTGEFDELISANTAYEIPDVVAFGDIDWDSLEDGQPLTFREFWGDTGVGYVTGHWKASEPTANHNGGTIRDPRRSSVLDPLTKAFNGYHTAVSGNTGCFVASEASIDQVYLYGGICDGTFDDTTPFIQAALVGPVRQIAGTLSIDSALFTVAVNIVIEESASIVARTPSTINSQVVDLQGADSVFVCKGAFDANSTNRTLCRVRGDNSVVYLHEAINVTANIDSSSSTSALQLEANNVRFGVKGRNHSNTGQPNVSVPRVVTTGGAADFRAEFVIGESVNTGMLNAGGSDGTCDLVHMTNVGDNSIYNIGATMRVSQLYQEDGFEPAVCTDGGDLTIDVATVIGKATGFGYNNHSTFNIGQLISRPNAAGETLPFIFRARTGHVSGGRMEIDRVDVVLNGSLLAAAVGTTDFIRIGGGKVRFLYDPATSVTVSQFGVFDGANKFEMTDLTITIIDVTNVLVGTDTMRMLAPSANLTGPSIFRDVVVHILNADESTFSAAGFRGQDFAQDLIYVSGSVWRTDIGPYIRESNYGGGNPDSISTSPPAGGTWRKGSDFALFGATASPFRTRCTVGGTPGTWVTY